MELLETRLKQQAHALGFELAGIAPATPADGMSQKGPDEGRGETQTRFHVMVPVYCREASQRPLQGTPPDAPFHLPEPLLPLSWPLA